MYKTAGRSVNYVFYEVSSGVFSAHTKQLVVLGPDILPVYIASGAVSAYQIPFSLLGNKVNGGSVGYLCYNVAVKAGRFSYVKPAAAGNNQALPKVTVGILWGFERYAQKLRYGKRKHPRHALQVCPYPFRILGVIVVPKLCQHRRRPCKP